MKLIISFDLNDKDNLVKSENNGISGYSLLKNGIELFFPKGFFNISENSESFSDINEKAKLLINARVNNTVIFSDWEKGFLESVIKVLDNNREFTNRQKSTIVKLYNRLTNVPKVVEEKKLVEGPIGVFDNDFDDVPF